MPESKAKRTEYVTLALTPAERDLLERAAKADQRGHTVYARMGALEKAHREYEAKQHTKRPQHGEGYDQHQRRKLDAAGA